MLTRPILGPRQFVIVGVGVASTLLIIGLSGSFGAIHDSWFRTSAGNQAHALEKLPSATMLQAADTCDGGHFGQDEIYGWWVQDFQMLLAGPAPIRAAERLVRDSSAMAQLYGLAALAVLDSIGTIRRLRDYRPAVDTVLVSEACDIQRRSVRQVIREIESGYWPAAMRRRPVDVH